MAFCDYCDKQFNQDDSNAMNNWDYCSRECEFHAEEDEQGE